MGAKDWHCDAEKKTGGRCGRRTGYGKRFCWQHRSWYGKEK